jgi:DNA end-binding protein Ku
MAGHTARPVWSGSISFGLVNVPIKLYTATESHRVAFHEFEEGTGERIHYQRVAEKSGKEVVWKKIRKGFEIAKGRFVVLSDDELKAAAPEKTRTIDIEQFVGLGEIDPASWDQTYYVGPDGASAAKAYALLRQSMADRKRVAIGRFVMRTKEYVVCIRPYENILALQTMFFPDEVRGTDIVGATPARVAVGSRELIMAGQLIDTLTAPWQPAKFEDTYTKRVMSLVRKKDQGKAIDLTQPEPKGGEVVDLMEALKATLAQQGRGKSSGRRGDAAPRGRTRGQSTAATSTRPRSATPGKRRPARRAARRAEG